MNLRTDLAIEASKTLQSNNKEIYIVDNVKVIETIVNEELSKTINKKEGNYYLMDLSDYNLNTIEDFNYIENALIKIIKKILKEEKIKVKDKGMIVGLGNIDVTPDSLGPLVANNVIVTRHLYELHQKEQIKGLRSICSISPGVMGVTGIETSDIITSIIKQIDIDFIIVIDALAASNINRINKTIQITNTGISPGSGVGNKRKEISKETLNIPVIAIGVPTVVDAVTIAYNTLDYVINNLEKNLKKDKKEIGGTFGILNEQDQKNVINYVLEERGINMMVTPKEVDQDIEVLSKIICHSLDKALHKLP